jgi:putative phosphoesterase
MQLGVLSDTAAIAVFRHARVDRILHCGDIGSETIVWLFDGFSVDFVLGNVDRCNAAAMRRALQEGGHAFHDEAGLLTLADRRIAFLHGDDRRRLQAAIAGGDFDLVCHGHTHAAANYRRGNTLVVNPGALHGTHHPSVAIVDLKAMEAALVTLD